MNRMAMSLAAGAALALGVAGCRVQVDKGVDGKDQKVKVDTPFGGVHLNTDQTTAADLGLPVYPGAQMTKDKENDKSSADVHVGFGDWQIHVRAVSYETADTREKVAAFYKKALARYGTVITCQDNAPVGTPAVTTEGLTCADDGSKHTGVNMKGDLNGVNISGDFELKAGSKRHQHVVGFKDHSDDGRTQFALVSLDLPAGLGKDSDKKDDARD